MFGSVKWFSLILVINLLVVLVGCGVNKETSAEGVLSVSKNPLEALAFFLVGIALAGGGWFVRNYWGRVGIGMMMFGAVSAFYVAPEALFENASADSEHFVSSQGFLGMTQHEVMMNDIDHIEIVTEKRRSRRTDDETYMVCHCKTGNQHKIQIDSRIQAPVAAYFMQLAQDQGIRIEEHD